jgi:UDP-3-O-[3-hydroxymyristoyl] glucosamine N-acyltransferase
MSERSFFRPAHGLTVAEIAALTRSDLRRPVNSTAVVTGIAAVDRAGPHDLIFLDNARFAAQASASKAAACLCLERLAAHVPAHVSLLIASDPYPAFVEVARALFPAALRPSSLFEAARAPGATVHATARVENGVSIDPGAVVGPRAEIGSGTIIGAGAVIGPDVRIGRDCAIGAHASISNTLIGDRVIVHPNAAIGQDGFGFLMGPEGHRKIPQIARVIIQDDVEIGAGTAIDRGVLRDTVIGEGTKIDNHVQVGHNVSIGRHCVIVAQSGIAGSSTLEDFVVLGAKVGVVDHVTIGEGSQIAASSNIRSNVPPGSRWGGTPAKPIKVWFREMNLLERMAREANRRHGGSEE